jgi:hypothetical protein
MAKRSKKPRDTNALAAAIVNQSTDDEDQGDDPYEGKDPDAVESGRRGGLDGGRVRAERLTPERRSEIARAAAQARWGKRRRSR